MKPAANLPRAAKGAFPYFSHRTVAEIDALRCRDLQGVQPARPSLFHDIHITQKGQQDHV
jgi:hypothetical protein